MSIPICSFQKRRGFQFRVLPPLRLVIVFLGATSGICVHKHFQNGFGEIETGRITVRVDSEIRIHSCLLILVRVRRF